MREKRIETRLKERMEAIGGECWKLWPMGRVGIPDRVCLFPGGLAVFAETKSPGKEPRKIQKTVHRRLRALGFEVAVIGSNEEVDLFIENYA